MWTEESIKGHFVVCYLALVIQRYLEYNLHQQGVELSTEKIQDAIRSATISLIEMDEQEFFIKNEPNEDFKDMLHALGLNDAPAYGKKSDAYIRPEKYMPLRNAITSHF